MKRKNKEKLNEKIFEEFLNQLKITHYVNLRKQYIPNKVIGKQ